MHRIRYFDVLKGLGILLVFIGHTLNFGILPSRMIYNFHMPLFFLVSGVFFTPEKYTSFGELWKRVFGALLLPWCLFTVLETVARLDVTIQEWTVHPLSSLLWLAHGDVGASLWFLMALASSMVFAWLLHARCKVFWHDRRFRIAILSALLLAAQVVSLIPDAMQCYFPFELTAVPSCSFVLLLGCFCRQHIQICVSRCEGRISETAQVGLLALIALASFSAMSSNYIILRFAHFDFLLLPACAAGLLTAACTALLLNRAPVLGLVFAWMGRNGLYLFALEHLSDRLFCKMLIRNSLPAYLFPCNTPHPMLYGVVRVVALLTITSVTTFVLVQSVARVKRLLAHQISDAARPPLSRTSGSPTP